jgi:hypothetical protein
MAYFNKQTHHDAVKQHQAGKGSGARNCYTKTFRDNYDLIKWKGNSAKKQ